MSHLIDILGQRGLLDAAGVSRARELLAGGKPLEEAIIAADGLSEEALLRALAEVYDVPFVDLDKVAPSREYLSQFPVRVLVGHNVLPLEDRDGRTLVAVSRLSDTAALDQLRVATGRDCTPALAPAHEIDRAIKRLLGVGADTLQSLDAGAAIEVIDEDETDLDASTAAHDASIIKFVNQILTEAIDSRATDVHVEPFEDQLRLRYRIDGVLQEANVPPNVRRFHAAIVSRIKILSHLDIAEKRLPQDGRS